MRVFSADAPKAAEKAAEEAPAEDKKEASSVPEPTKEELEAGRLEWGIKYDDECLKFEKEWEIIAQKVEQEQNMFLESELGELQ